jgi:hypothetical protein
MSSDAAPDRDNSPPLLQYQFFGHTTLGRLALEPRQQVGRKRSPVGLRDSPSSWTVPEMLLSIVECARPQRFRHSAPHVYGTLGSPGITRPHAQERNQSLTASVARCGELIVAGAESTVRPGIRSNFASMIHRALYWQPLH